jgi:alpha-N-arabinofuranosidase
VTFLPKAESEKAGLLIFQNETHFYFLCKSVMGSEPVIQLYKSVGNDKNDTSMALIASQRITREENMKPLRLKIEAHDSTYAFLYGFGEKGWATLSGNVDAGFLSTKIAGGFVGCMYALYATSLGKSTTGKAYYDWFEYTGNDEVYERAPHEL